MPDDEKAREIESYHTITEIAKKWQVDPVTVRGLFRGRKGVMQLAPGGAWRIPASLVEEVVRERQLQEGSKPKDGSKTKDEHKPSRSARAKKSEGPD